jgi:GDP-L-fucose synthase
LKKVLITGANSFIARNLIEQLTEYNIITCDSKQLNLLDFNLVYDFLKQEKFDTIIHTATWTHDTENMFDYNIKMFLNLYSNKQFFNKMLYFGSGAEYFDDINNVYSQSKIYMNKLCQNTNIYNLRLFATFGKYDKDIRPISSLCLQKLNSNKLKLNVNYYYDYLYTKDIGKIVKWFIENKPLYNDYNVCSGISRSFCSIAEIINSFDDNLLSIEIVNKDDFKEYSGNNSRLLNEIKNFEFTSFYDALKELFTWYKENKIDYEGKICFNKSESS